MQISGKTRILGIFGDPVAHSLSPVMQNAAIAAAGIDAVYVPFHVVPSDLENAVHALRALEILGVNVTVPHKENVLPLLDVIDEEANLIGAVNTIVNRDGILTGYNTDSAGLLVSLKDDLGFSPHGTSVVVLGAGGAARAAIVSLARAGVEKISIVNRSVDKANSLVEEFSPRFPQVDFSALSLGSESVPDVLDSAQLLVNSSTVGLKGESFPVPLVERLPENAAVYDMVYSLQPTPLQLAAADRGLKFCDGRGMLAGQGEAAFRLWFDAEPPVKIMHQQIVK